jgi:hypothetical protein
MKNSLRGVLSLFFLFVSILPAFPVTWDGGGANNLASTSANWNTTPHHGDDIFFDETNSKDCTWDFVKIANVDKIFSSFTIEGGYAGTVTFDSALILLNTLTLPDTGQIECYDSGGILMDNCDGTGQDGYYTIHPMSFTDNGDGTITDNVTGLQWQKCTNGQSGVECATGSPTGSDWATAAATCASLDLDGIGWRLPEDFELVNLADYGRHGPAIDPIFPNTSAYYYWTANSYSGNALNANIVYFHSGLIANIVKSDISIFTRCVRGTRAAKGTAFVDNGDGTITDDATGLLWQKCSYGQTNDASCSGSATQRTWDQALSDCEGLSLLGYPSWRLPNIKELNSISDTALYPATNSTFFPNSPEASWWSSTTTVTTTWALGVSFGSGGIMVNLPKSDSEYVRCVMGQ